jgi:hypothetical protein
MSTRPPHPGPGERQPGESPKAFAAFRTYVDLGPGRTTAEVGRRLGHSSARQAQTWSSRWRWVERVSELASADALAADDGRREELRRIAERQAKEARLHIAATTVVIREILRRAAEDPEFAKQLGADRLLQLGATHGRTFARLVPVERLALGMTTEQPGEPTPHEEARDMAARLTEHELDARLAGLDALRDVPRDRRGDREERRQPEPAAPAADPELRAALSRPNPASALDRLRASDPMNNPNNKE